MVNKKKLTESEEGQAMMEYAAIAGMGLILLLLDPDGQGPVISRLLNSLMSYLDGINEVLNMPLP